MATTWAELMTTLRSWLGDTTAKYPDSKLFPYAQTAIRDLSLRLPRTSRATLAFTNKEAAMPTDWIGSLALRVFYGSTELRQSDAVTPTSGFYTIVDGALVLYNDFSAVDIMYQGGYDVPATMPVAPVPETDPPTVLPNVSVPDVDLECIYWFVTSMVFGEIAGKDSALQRWDEKGKRDDSPLIPEHRWRMMRYHDAVDIRRMTRSASALRKR